MNQCDHSWPRLKTPNVFPRSPRVLRPHLRHARFARTLRFPWIRSPASKGCSYHAPWFRSPENKPSVTGHQQQNRSVRIKAQAHVGVRWSRVDSLWNAEINFIKNPITFLESRQVDLVTVRFFKTTAETRRSVKYFNSEHKCICDIAKWVKNDIWGFCICSEK